MSGKKFVSNAYREQILVDISVQAKELDLAQLELAVSWVEEVRRCKQADLEERLQARSTGRKGSDWDRLIEQSNISPADFDRAFA